MVKHEHMSMLRRMSAKPLFCSMGGVPGFSGGSSLLEETIVNKLGFANPGQHCSLSQGPTYQCGGSLAGSPKSRFAGLRMLPFACLDPADADEAGEACKV